MIQKNIYFFSFEYMKMVKITENKLKLTAKNKGIKDYQNM